MKVGYLVGMTAALGLVLGLMLSFVIHGWVALCKQSQLLRDSVSSSTKLESAG